MGENSEKTVGRNPGSGWNIESLRENLRTALFHWEFWVPPALAVISITVIGWLLNHNQDLIRQHQIDNATIREGSRLKEQMRTLSEKMDKNTEYIHDLRLLKEEMGCLSKKVDKIEDIQKNRAEH